MAQVKRAQLQVYPLRGMDLRWRPGSKGQDNIHSATLVRDLTWYGNDAWRDSGGFRVVREDTPTHSDPVNDDSDPNPTAPWDPAWSDDPTGGTGGPNG